MKKIFAILLVLMLALSLCACPALEQEATSGKPQVHITVGKIEPGMTAKDVFAEVTIDNQPVPCRVQLTGFVWDGYWEMAADEPVPEPFAVRVDIFYSLPKGCDVEDVDITMDSDGGNYDGTGSIGNDDDGNIEAWSRAFYGKEPIPPETEPTESTTQPTEQQTSQDVTVQTAPHVHRWVEKNEDTFISCTTDAVKTYACTCGTSKQETIPAPGHDMRDGGIQNPTCTDTGSQTKRCSRCSFVLVIEIPATGHAWSDWAHETGLVHKRTCSTCGAEEEARHNIPSGSVTCTDCGADIIN